MEEVLIRKARLFQNFALGSCDTSVFLADAHKCSLFSLLLSILIWVVQYVRQGIVCKMDPFYRFRGEVLLLFLLKFNQK